MATKRSVNRWLLLVLAATAFISVYFYLRDTGFYLFGDTSELSDIRKRNLPWTILHFAFAGLPLLLGPLQFIPQIRINYPKFHRTAGKLYIIGSLVSALTVFALLATVYTLPGAILSLGLLAVIWLFTTVAAYLSIRKGNVNRHREFMIRSYVCSLAFVFIRLLPVVNNATGIFNFIEDDVMRSTVYEWICWVYPLMMVEFWLIWRKQLTGA